MKTNLKAIALMLLIISSSVFICCNDEFEERDGDGRKLKNDENFDGEICNGKQILSFSTRGELQQEHLNLYNQYVLNNEDEQVLRDYETANGFYSLRKKEQDMDDGIIPVDPLFDETNFTFDPVFETLLNEDGMIIIGDRLYLWDSGCIIQSIPFSCSNYENLLNFYHAVKSNSSDAMHSIFIENRMTNINTCDDASYDFESISENGGRYNAEKPRVKNKNSCGYDVVLNSKLISCENDFYEYEVSFQNIAPLGSGTPLNLFTLASSSGDLTGVQLAAMGSPWMDVPDEVDYLPIPNAGFGTTFNIRVPMGTSINYYLELTSTIGLLSGNSCTASNGITIDSNCPFTIEAILNYANASETSWTFTIPETNGCLIPGSKVKWNFGDGTPEIEAGFSVTHVYSACTKQTATVTAIIKDQTVCGVFDKLFIKSGIPYGNNCMRENYTFPTHEETVDGKKMKLRAKLKRNFWTLHKSKFTQVYKFRKDGNKTIKCVGNIYKPSANNTACIQGNIASVVPSKTTSGKKRNKQTEKFQTIYLINALDPYQVQFTHSNYPQEILTANNLYCSQ